MTDTLDQELADLDRTIAATERWQRSQFQNERIQRMCRKALAGLHGKANEIRLRRQAAEEVRRATAV